jgi:hypothetical protein
MLALVANGKVSAVSVLHMVHVVQRLCVCSDVLLVWPCDELHAGARI